MIENGKIHPLEAKHVLIEGLQVDDPELRASYGSR